MTGSPNAKPWYQRKGTLLAGAAIFVVAGLGVVWQLDDNGLEGVFPVPTGGTMGGERADWGARPRGVEEDDGCAFVRVESQDESALAGWVDLRVFEAATGEEYYRAFAIGEEACVVVDGGTWRIDSGEDGVAVEPARAELEAGEEYVFRVAPWCSMSLSVEASGSGEPLDGRLVRHDLEVSRLGVGHWRVEGACGTEVWVSLPDGRNPSTILRNGDESLMVDGASLRCFGVSVFDEDGDPMGSAEVRDRDGEVERVGIGVFEVCSVHSVNRVSVSAPGHSTEYVALDRNEAEVSLSAKATREVRCVDHDGDEEPCPQRAVRCVSLADQSMGVLDDRVCRTADAKAICECPSWWGVERATEGLLGGQQWWSCDPEACAEPAERASVVLGEATQAWARHWLLVVGDGHTANLEPAEEYPVAAGTAVEWAVLGPNGFAQGRAVVDEDIAIDATATPRSTGWIECPEATSVAWLWKDLLVANELMSASSGLTGPDGESWLGHAACKSGEMVAVEFRQTQ